MIRYKVYYMLWVEVETKEKKEAVTEAHELLTEELAQSHFDTEGIRPQKVGEQTNNSDE